MIRRRCSLFRCRSIFVAAMLSALGATALLAEDEPRYTLEEVTDRLKAWQEKIDTLRVHTRTVCDPHAKWAIEAGQEGIERIGYDDWIWTSAGQIRHQGEMAPDRYARAACPGVSRDMSNQRFLL